MANSVFERMCLIFLPFSTPSSVSNRKEPFFYRGQPSSSLLGPVMCKNVQKSYYGPCKINRSSPEGDFKDSITRKRWLGRHSPPPPSPNSLPQTWKGGKRKEAQAAQDGKEGTDGGRRSFHFFWGGETDTAAFTNSVFLLQS